MFALVLYLVNSEQGVSVLTEREKSKLHWRISQFGGFNSEAIIIILQVSNAKI